MDLQDIIKRTERASFQCDRDPAGASGAMAELIVDVEDASHGREDLRTWIERTRGQISRWADQGRDRIRLWQVIFDARIHLREIEAARAVKAGSAPARETAAASGW